MSLTVSFLVVFGSQLTVLLTRHGRLLVRLSGLKRYPDFFSQKHFHKKVYYKYRISHTAVLVVINVLTRGIGVIVVVVGAVELTPGTSEKKDIKKEDKNQL